MYPKKYVQRKKHQLSLKNAQKRHKGNAQKGHIADMIWVVSDIFLVIIYD